MTITQILESARNNLNALSDSLWSDSELLLHLYQCELKMARTCRTIENIYTTTSVSGTDEYTKPTRAMEIWRVTFDGKKLDYRDFRYIDTMNPNDVTSSGTPQFYSYYDDAFFLYPTPSSAATIKVFSYDEPSIPTVSSTLETPTAYHDVLVDGVTFKMCPKEVGHPLTIYWKGEWEAGLARVELFARRRRRGDKFNTVKTEEQMLNTEFGII